MRTVVFSCLPNDLELLDMLLDYFVSKHWLLKREGTDTRYEVTLMGEIGFEGIGIDLSCFSERNYADH